jgi:hypothetical protein
MDTLHVNVGDVGEQPEYFQKPDNDDDYNHDIQDGFDLMIHGNVCVDKPKKNPRNNQYDNNS